MGVSRLVEIVGLNERYAGAAVFSFDDSRVIAGIERGDDGGFEIIRRRNSRGNDFVFLRVFPIVIRHDVSGLVQFENGIGQGTRDRWICGPQ